MNTLLLWLTSQSRNDYYTNINPDFKAHRLRWEKEAHINRHRESLYQTSKQVQSLLQQSKIQVNRLAQLSAKQLAQSRLCLKQYRR